MMRLILLLAFLTITSSSWAKVLVISDIDDTLKRSNVLNLASAARRLLKDHPPFFVLADIYTQIQQFNKSDPAQFAYISASTSYMYDAKDWIQKKKLPTGIYFQRPSIWTDKESFKKEKIHAFLKQNYKTGDTVLFFGDNAEIDPKIYKSVTKQLELTKTAIFIRDVRMHSSEYTIDRTDEQVEEGVHYFATGLEILDHEAIVPYKNKILPRAKKLAQEHKLLATYQVRRLARQLYRCYRQFACRPERERLILKHIERVNEGLFARLSMD